MKSLWRLWPYIRRHRALLLLAYGAMVLLGATTALYAFLAGPALKFVFSGDFGDVLRDSRGNLREAWGWLPSEWITHIESLDRAYALAVVPALIVLVALAKGIAQTTQFHVTGVLAQRSLFALRKDIFDALLGQSPAFFHRRTHGDLQSRLTHDAQLVEQAVFYGCAPLLREPLAVLFLLGFCFYLNFKLAFVTFIIVPVAVIPLVRFARRLKTVSRRGQNFQGEISAVSYEALAGIEVVQAFGGERHERQKLQQAAEHYYRQMLKSYFIRAIRTPTMEVLGAVALGLLLFALGYYVHHHQADPAHFISFFVAIVMMYDPLKKLGHVSDHLAAGAAAMERIGEILAAPRAIGDKPNARTLPPFTHSVRFEHVSFQYDDAPVLQDIHFELRAGEQLALVGASGAGKTTLARLLPRFYDVTGGSIQVDGLDIRDVTLRSLRQQISIVSQDNFLFNTSIRHNIAYARPEAPMDAIVRAAKAAHADEFIESLPNGYDTVIGERGSTLSGGQKQRIAIARALLRDAPLLILDEATSALDADSEGHVQRALDELMQDRTTLVIAHRLSTVRRATKIAVLRGGRIVESGTHEELLAANGEYARLYTLQFAEEPELQQVAR